MFGQIRSVTRRGQARATGARCAGRSSAVPARSRTLRGRIRQPRRTCSLPITATGRTGAPVSSARRPTPRFGRASEPWRIRVPSGKITTVPPRSTASAAVSIAVSSDWPRRIGNAPSRFRIQPCQRFSNSSTLATNWICRRHGSSAPITNGSRKLRWFEATIRPPFIRACSRPCRSRRNQTRKKGTRTAADDRVDEPVDAVLARELVVAPKALVGDDVVGAWRRRGSRAILHAQGLPAHAARLPAAARCACYQAASTRARSSSRSGGSGVICELGAVEDRVERQLQLRAVGAHAPTASGARRRAPRPGPRARRAWSRAPSRARSSACRRAGSAPRARAAGSPRWSRRAESASPGPGSGRSRGGARTWPSRSRSRRGSSRARGRCGRPRPASPSSAVAISFAPRSAASSETGLASGV